jgi:hypothetical protein
MLLAAPELWVLTMACVILVADLFLSAERRSIIHLPRRSLVCRHRHCAPTLPGRGHAFDAAQQVLYPRPDGRRAEAVQLRRAGDCLHLRQFCLRQFRMFRTDFYTLALSLCWARCC